MRFSSPLGLVLAIAAGLAGGCRAQDPPRRNGGPLLDSPPLRARGSAALEERGAVPVLSAEVTRPRLRVAFGDGQAEFVVPPGAGGGRVPLVLVLHGLGGVGEAAAESLGLRAFAQRQGFAYVAPNGSLDALGRRYWNAGSVCCNFFNGTIDDTARLRDLVDYGIQNLGVDRERVFVVGYSNGGFMAHRLACAHGDRIAGIVSIAAAGPAEASACSGRDTVAVLEIHGDADTVVPAQGGHLFGRPELPRSPNIETGLGVWADRNDCNGELQSAARVDLVRDIPGVETEVLRFTSCPRAPVELWTVRGGEHILDLGGPGLEHIWSFLAAQRKSASRVH